MTNVNGGVIQLYFLTNVFMPWTFPRSIFFCFWVVWMLSHCFQWHLIPVRKVILCAGLYNVYTVQHQIYIQIRWVWTLLALNKVGGDWWYCAAAALAICYCFCRSKITTNKINVVEIMSTKWGKRPNWRTNICYKNVYTQTVYIYCVCLYCI